MLSKNSLAEDVNEYFSSHSGNIRYIFSPFIQKKTIERILPSEGIDTIIITRWRHEDISSGVSDPDVYKFCEDRGFTLKCNHRLHAKVYSWDLREGLVGSANLTDTGMGEASENNIEVMTNPIELTPDTQLKLRQAEKNAQLVTDSGYQTAVEISKENTAGSKKDNDRIEMESQPDFLTSQLPMTEDPNVIISVLSEDNDQNLDDLSAPLYQCVLHDIASYSLDELQGLPENELKIRVKKHFENHPFIKEIINNMEPDIYFGEMKELVQNRCEDVPTPSRRELTEDIQILYEWFKKISPDRFDHDIPKSHSERLIDTKSSQY